MKGVIRVIEYQGEIDALMLQSLMRSAHASVPETEDAPVTAPHEEASKIEAATEDAPKTLTRDEERELYRAAIEHARAAGRGYVPAREYLRDRGVRVYCNRLRAFAGRNGIALPPSSSPERLAQVRAMAKLGREASQAKQAAAAEGPKVITTDYATAMRWAAERGMVMKTLDLPEINKRRAANGLPSFALAGKK